MNTIVIAVSAIYPRPSINITHKHIIRSVDFFLNRSIRNSIYNRDFCEGCTCELLPGPRLCQPLRWHQDVVPQAGHLQGELWEKG